MPAAKKYKYVEHTADIEFVAYGKNLEELFKNALLALFDTTADIKKLSASKTKVATLPINDKARTVDDLLWFALQDALSVADAERVFGFDVKKVKISGEEGEYAINASISAKKIDQKFAKFNVKGVSKFDMNIVETPRGFEASVVLDV